MTKHVYFFGNGKAEGRADMRATLGGKGANLAEMTNIGLPVPPGFTISTEVCDWYNKHDKAYPPGVQEEIDKNIGRLEEAMGMKLGDPANPLLVSVRSGAAASMPGMMDTVLNLGLNDKAVQGMIKKTGNERFVWDSYRRLINMFGDVVMGVHHDHFEDQLKALKAKAGVAEDTALTVSHLKELCDRYKKVYKEHTGHDFPQDPRDQLAKSIAAVFGSWSKDTAVSYRQINKIEGLLGTAVNVQAMVYGNMGDTSATGVCMTRDNSTGENVFSGEFLVNAQGEDVVGGIRTPRPIKELQQVMPKAYQQLLDIKKILENHFKEMQDLEFTVQENKLFMLQTRTGKRSPTAAVRIAVEMANEGLIDKKTALLRVDPRQVPLLLLPVFDSKAPRQVLAKGLPASPGAASGKVAFTAADAETRAAAGEKVLLVREFTSPEDVRGMHAAEGILTSTGGMTSHAAIVACGWGKPCVVGCNGLNIDARAKTLKVGGQTFTEKDYLSIDGGTGEVMKGQVATKPPEVSDFFATLMKWADEVRQVGVRTNADTPDDAGVARKFGAEGIGLCRTEHMFFGTPDEAKGKPAGYVPRINYVRQMVLAASTFKRLEKELAKAREEHGKASGHDQAELGQKVKQLETEFQGPRAGYLGALEKLLPEQRADFEGIFKAMDGYPVTIRLIDPPLHEFLPKEDAQQAAIAKQLGVDVAEVRRRMKELHEENPMLGLRGCRLGIVYPEITDMQVRAIFEAACNVARAGVKVEPEIMVPLVGTVQELAFVKERVQRIGAAVMKEKGTTVKYLTGTMIEVPRAALTADQIAKEAEFFSFGTNDLTQTTYGYSRDDVGSFVPEYRELKILAEDPFQVLDQVGVGSLIRQGIEKGRSVNSKLKVGICGEHGGEPSSVEFCVRVGMNYVSCSPFRVPTARLAAAQAVLRK
jgi:pyruvate, orthophosphate dikinase